MIGSAGATGATSNLTGSAGGAAVSTTISGLNVAYARGGGQGNGGAPNGGGTSSSTGNGSAGTANLGNGGGGAGSTSGDSRLGGNGGSGIVIIDAGIVATSTTGSPTLSGTIYTFTGNGSITY